MTAIICLLCFRHHLEANNRTTIISSLSKLTKSQPFPSILNLCQPTSPPSTRPPTSPTLPSCSPKAPPPTLSSSPPTAPTASATPPNEPALQPSLRATKAPGGCSSTAPQRPTRALRSLAGSSGQRLHTASCTAGLPVDPSSRRSKGSLGSRCRDEMVPEAARDGAGGSGALGRQSVRNRIRGRLTDGANAVCDLMDGCERGLGDWSELVSGSFASLRYASPWRVDYAVSPSGRGLEGKRSWSCF